MRVFRSPGAQFDDIKDRCRLTHPFVLGDLPDFERHRDVIQHRPVRHQGKVLEYHPDLAISEVLKVPRPQRHYIGAFNLDLAGCRLKQAVEVAERARRRRLVGLEVPGERRDRVVHSLEDGLRDAGVLGIDSPVGLGAPLVVRDGFRLSERIVLLGARHVDAADLEIAEVLGHRTLQMVRRYAHLSESHVKGLVESLGEDIFEGAADGENVKEMTKEKTRLPAGLL